tara:strand:+ start:343 stop:1389 length:1047 start_codon:yes stop_codon:yes gene_type:complete
MKLNNFFLEHCKKNKYEINKNQLEIIDILENYYTENFQQTFLKKIFKKNDNRLGFYLVGDVGVGKTMILNFFFNIFKEKKLRLHFNEFMINFHDFLFNYENKNDAIDLFVKKLKREVNLLYFDEFQVTNIVDAMILGKLFKKIFEKNIKVIFSSNIKINDLYKDGLQRDQFIPFIKILKFNSYEKELLIEDDYRASKNKNLNRFLSPINQSTNFILNKFFRQITKNKKKLLKVIEIKGRKFEIKIFFEGVAKFDFNELCDRNLGSEDFINIANICNFIFIENLPNFNENNSNQQQRFITLIDIIYEKKVPLMITSQVNLETLDSSKSISRTFKRTISRIHELTSMYYN